MRDPGRLHVITDEVLGGPHGHVELARQAALGGADVVQFREKRAWSTARLVATAREMLEALGSGTRLIVNDRVDVAIASGAAGVHLGPEDLEPAVGRHLLGSEPWIGATAPDGAAVDRLAREPVDYVGVGPVFATRSKGATATRPPIGLEGLAAIVRRSARPVIAIGGFDPERAALAIAAGAWGVAVLWDVAGRDDASERVRAFRQAVDGAVEHARRNSR